MSKSRAFKVKIETIEGDLCNIYVTQMEAQVIFRKVVLSREVKVPMGWRLLRVGRGYRVIEQHMTFRESTLELIVKALAK